MPLADKVAIVTGGETGIGAAIGTSRKAMHAAHEINGLTFAHAIVTTRDTIAGFSAA